MRRETQNILLLLLGGALCKIAWNGSYLRYVKPSVLPFLVSAGVVILALGLISIGRDVLAGRDAADQHDHAGRSPWLLVLPVLAIFLVAPPALGADTVARSARTLAPHQPSVRFPALPAGPAPALPMSDFVTRAAWDDAGSVNGRQVRLVGFIVHGGNTTYLGRLVISCCAADATPVKVRLEGRTGLAYLPQDSWYEVRGQVVPGSARSNTRFTPTLTVSDLHPIPTPREPYEY
ncbi:MAG: TIGR03943 family protein [Actinomycetota bacterium]|nr:TIGR03943 family protein [Actinomycetota bacterium]